MPKLSSQEEGERRTMESEADVLVLLNGEERKRKKGEVEKIQASLGMGSTDDGATKKNLVVCGRS